MTRRGKKCSMAMETERETERNVMEFRHVRSKGERSAPKKKTFVVFRPLRACFYELEERSGLFRWAVWRTLLFRSDGRETKRVKSGNPLGSVRVNEKKNSTGWRLKSELLARYNAVKSLLKGVKSAIQQRKKTERKESPPPRTAQWKQRLRLRSGNLFKWGLEVLPSSSGLRPPPFGINVSVSRGLASSSRWWTTMKEQEDPPPFSPPIFGTPFPLAGRPSRPRELIKRLIAISRIFHWPFFSLTMKPSVASSLSSTRSEISNWRGEKKRSWFTALLFFFYPMCRNCHLMQTLNSVAVTLFISNTSKQIVGPPS